MADKTVTWLEIRNRKRKNEIATVLQHHSLNAADFLFEHAMVSHRSTGESFDFHDLDDGANILRFSNPGLGNQMAKASSSFAASITAFGGWCDDLTRFLNAVEEHLHTPDLFEEGIESGSALITLAEASHTENFAISNSERALLLVRLNDLETFVREQAAITGEQSVLLASEIRYLGQAGERLGRKDWLHVLIAVLVNLVTSGIFAPDRTDELIRYALAVFRFLADPPSLGT